MEIEKDLYIKILSHLSKFGINHEADIFDLFNKSFIEPKNKEEVFDMARGYIHINGFLKGMKIYGHIECNEIAYKEPSGSTAITWMDTFPIIASITDKGYEYVNQQKNLRFTRNMSKAALILSIVAFLATSYKFIVDNNLKSKVQQLEKQVNTLEKSSKQKIYPIPKNPKPLKNN